MGFTIVTVNEFDYISLARHGIRKGKYNKNQLPKKDFFKSVGFLKK